MIRTTIAWFRSKDHRAYAYRAAGVLGVVALGAGWLTSGQEQTILTDVGLILGVGGNGLASIHTPTPRARARSARKAHR
jgi:hypothetical protein